MRLLIAAGAALALAATLWLSIASPPRATAETVPTSAAEMQLSFAPVARAAAPAVVNIYATRVVAERSSLSLTTPSSANSSATSAAPSRACRTRWGRA